MQVFSGQDLLCWFIQHDRRNFQHGTLDLCGYLREKTTALQEEIPHSVSYPEKPGFDKLSYGS